MMAWLTFIVIAACLLASAFMVVQSRDLIRSVLWLGVTLVMTAVLYVTLQADFIAAAQILLYTGGVVTLMLFGVMLTARLESARLQNESHHRLRGAGVTLAVAALVALAVFRSTGSFAAAPEMVTDTQALGALFLSDMMLPFEVISVLLLAVMIGAIALARKRDP